MLLSELLEDLETQKIAYRLGRRIGSLESTRRVDASVGAARVWVVNHFGAIARCRIKIAITATGNVLLEAKRPGFCVTLEWAPQG